MDLRKLYNELATRERDWNPWADENHVERIETIVNWVIEVAPHGGKVLDAGCAHGEVAAAIAKNREDLHVVGIDISDVWVNEATLRHIDVPNVEFKRADVRNLPFDDNSFDVVICAEVLEHLPGNDWRAALKELDRVSSGRIIITIPDDREPDGTYHVTRIEPDDVLNETSRTLARFKEIRINELRIKRVWVMMLE